MNRASFLKLLALPVVAPLVALSTKIRGHWREEFARDVWVDIDGSETPLEEMEHGEWVRFTVDWDWDSGRRVKFYRGSPSDGEIIWTEEVLS